MNTSIKNLFLLPTLMAGLGLLPAGHVTAQTFTTLYNFGVNAPHNPESGLVLSGNTLYGTAYGGNPSDGCVFGINTDGSGFAIVHGFTGLDGFAPTDGLILSGNTLFGTAYRTVFAVNTDTSGFTILHSFVPGDGTYPVGGVVLSGNTLYGTASQSGIADMGTVFAVNTDSSGFSVLHYFTAITDSTNSDGGRPRSTLILSGSTLYGTANEGGSTSRGTVFAVNTDGLGFTNLHNFTAATNDGAFPYAGVILSGNTLYGTTASGGAHGYGTVFAVNTDGSGFTLLHSFIGSAGDGVTPVAGVILSGNTLYGTTYNGGNGGTVFAVNTDGTGFTVLHTFIAGEGGGPCGDLILAGDTLYGTTMGGGTNGTGTVFSLTLPPPQLAITPAGADVVLTWPVSATGFTLQSATNLVPPVVWITNSPAPVIINGQNTVTNPVSGTQKFYRLSQ